MGWTDEQYVGAVDNGSYTRFTTDAYGVGIHQWTLKYRKNKMLNRARAQGVSVGDLDFQIGFAIFELEGEGEYSGLWKALKTSNDVDALSDMVVGIYERPANATQQKLARRPLSRKWLAAFGGAAIEAEEDEAYWPPRTIAQGMSGPDVAVWQALMTAYGYRCPVSGEFDAQTHSATVSYQEDHGLIADGIPGPKPWAAGVRM
jgi:peptidoglycan hydrolase-like protein with peptidoglycan-binding domain